MIGPFLAACAHNYTAACASADARMVMIAPYLDVILAIEVAVIICWAACVIYKKMRRAS